MPLIIDSYYQCLLDCKIVFTANKFITSLVKYEIMSLIYSIWYTVLLKKYLQETFLQGIVGAPFQSIS